MSSVYFDDGQVKLMLGHVLDCQRELPSDSVQCVVTSPPYWALRSYATEPQVWGGDHEHAHVWTESARLRQSGGDGTASAKQVSNNGSQLAKVVGMVGDCQCGAWRGELGHEPTPQMFVQHLVEVFREVRRVLKPDGVCFVNLGDAMGGSGKGPTGKTSINTLGTQEQRQGFSDQKTGGGVKAKSLALIPERFALAMQDDGWYVRSRIAWCKRAPMPESVRDRPTNAWEHIWLFSKSASYFWDADAVRETTGRESDPDEYAKLLSKANDRGDWYTRQDTLEKRIDGTKHGKQQGGIVHPNGRNMWNYWLLSPDPEPMAHFATFPREVPRRCIAAATSERGECPKCGKSWVRVVERSGVDNSANEVVPDYEVPGLAKGTPADRVRRLRGPIYQHVKKATEQWTPQCACGLEPVPSTVLDPFVGSGTTTMVARSMLRRSIGIDLSADYLKNIALKKNAQMALMAAPETEAS